MKFTSKEENILVVIGSTIALYDFFTIPFNSFLITTAFAALLFYLTRSPFMVTFVYVVPLPLVPVEPVSESDSDSEPETYGL